VPFDGNEEPTSTGMYLKEWHRVTVSHSVLVSAFDEHLTVHRQRLVKGASPD
jgi:hypothetical protein